MQLALVCACIVILLFGLAITGLGLWAYRSQEKYLSITDQDPELTRLPYSMMVTGGFVAFLGLVGVTGSIFSRTITGQTLLGVFSFVLVLVIVSEVGAGAAAIHLKLDLDNIFETAALKSQMRYNESTTVAEHWDAFQQEFRCCGAKGYNTTEGRPPYYVVFKNVSVPTSCCRKETSPEQCSIYAHNATEYRQYIYNDGCPSTVLGKLTRNTTAVAVIAIVVGSTQLLAVLLAVVVAYMSSRLDSGEKTGSPYTYNKLVQQETEENSQPTAT